jgi:uncharacterized Fe-S cluster protein YjdI
MDLKNIKKEYTNGEITIVWQSSKCIHCANCKNDNPEAFQPQNAPWIKMENSTTERLIETVNKCPSGAISYFRN